MALEYSTDGGGTWQAISGAGALDYALGQYVWNTSGLPSGGYRVRVNYGGGTLTDLGDDPTSQELADWTVARVRAFFGI